MLLDKKKLLVLEGFNKKFGWHAYMIYDKVKADRLFNHHYIKNNLLQLCLKHGKERAEERPLWVAPEEVINNITECKRKSGYISRSAKGGI